MRLELIVQTYGQLTDVVGQLPEFSKWHSKAPLFFDSLDPAFAHLCRIEVPEGYFRVTHAIPKPSRKQAFLWYEIKPRAVTPTSNKDVLVWDTQLASGDWVPNKFGAVQRSLAQPIFQKVRKQATPDFIAPDSGPLYFFVDAQLCGLLAGEWGESVRCLPLLNHQGVAHADRRVLWTTESLPPSSFHLAERVPLYPGAVGLRNVVLLAYGPEAYRADMPLALTSETDEYGYPILLAHDRFKQAVEQAGCKGLRFSPVFDAASDAYREALHLRNEAERLVSQNRRNRFLREPLTRSKERPDA
jgi:hypothetical protein